MDTRSMVSNGDNAAMMVDGMEMLQFVVQWPRVSSKSYLISHKLYDVFILQIVLNFMLQDMAKSQWLDILLGLKHTIAVTMVTSFMAYSGGSVCMMGAGMEVLQHAIQSSIKESDILER